MSTSPRSDVVQWQDRSTIQLLEHIASLEKEANIESQRATHYREQWQTSLMALKEAQNTIRLLCADVRRCDAAVESANERIKQLEAMLNMAVTHHGTGQNPTADQVQVTSIRQYH
jgi:chromosome segregation ATPase